MRHQKRKKILGRKKAPRKALMQNLATNLIIYEKITTTQTKAKTLRPFIEKIITLGKVNNLTNRRRLLKLLYLKKAVNKTLDIVGPKYKDRNGGYVRIINMGQRKGDGAKMARIEFI